MTDLLARSIEPNYSDSVIFDASGYLMGTSHHASISNGLFKSRGKSSVTRPLTDAEKRELKSILKKYWAEGKFHAPSQKDVPRCCDIGASRFIYQGSYADPDEVPKLSKLFLSIDPGLSLSPGGL